VTSFIGESFVDNPFTRKLAERAKLEENGTASNIQISCETASKEVSHDFSTSRICELPIRVRIRNTHPQRHRVSISLRHVAKVRDSVDGIHLVAPENRHQMWTDRPVSRRNFIKPDEWADVEMKWKVSHAAVYDVGGAN
uniref:TPPC8 C-terminal Ig-like domain-containing protein n=1 Tax=Caenorhabditis japonica TaxID=281687 RepID=A0A8R1EAJ0_CAEJA